MRDSYNPTIKVDEVAYHRNGMCGAPFHVVTFRYRVGGERKDRHLVAFVFEAAAHVAVMDRELLGAGAIAFGGTDDGCNSWRGDTFEKPLRAAIAAHQAAEDARYAPPAPIDPRD